MGIVVVFGYPAIYYQLRSFNLPLHVIGYKNVLYAGVIPTVAFVGFFAYGYWVYQQLQKDKKMESILTIVAVGMPLLLVEVLALLVVLIYAYVWVAARIPILLGARITRNGMIDFSMILIAAVFAYQILIAVFPGMNDAIKKFFSRFTSRFRKPKNEPPDEDEPGEPKEKPVKKESVADTTPLLAGLVFGAMTFLGYLSLMWIIEVRYPGLYARIEPYKPLLFRISVVFSCVVAALFLVSLMRNYIVGRALFFSLIVLAFLGLVYMYSTQWYRKIDIRLGGGKPEPVNIWVKKSDFPEPLLARYGQVLSKDTTAYTNWQNALLLLENEKEFALTTPDSVWVIIPKDKVLLFERVKRKR